MRTLTLQEVEAVNGALSIEVTALEPALAAPRMDSLAAFDSPKSIITTTEVARPAPVTSNSSQVCTPAHQSVSWDGQSLRVKDYSGSCVSGGIGSPY